MARHREFTAARAESRGEPLTFAIVGPETETDEGVEPGQRWEFTIAQVPAGPLLDMMAAFTAGGTNLVAAFARFLYDVMPEDQQPALHEALRHIDTPMAMQLVSWIIEEETARPLGLSGVSAAGQSSNGATSKLEAASIGWTPSE